MHNLGDLAMKYLLSFFLTLGLFVGVGAVIPVLPHCMVLRAQSTRPMPPERNPKHEDPGFDNFCRTPTSEHPVDADHACWCHRECKPGGSGEDEEGNSISTPPYVQEDGKCRAYCFHDHCKCPMYNCEV